MTEAASPTLQLYERPVLVFDPNMHTAQLRRAETDRNGCYLVTGSDDKTVRIWSVEDGTLLRTIRMPAGPGNIGKIYAVAISPDGSLVAAGGWTRWADADLQQQIYLFDRATGAIVTRIERLPEVVFHLAFSPDGRFLAATLGGSNGMRVYAHAVGGWYEIARDASYGDSSFGASFAADGRLATTSWDGHVRLYTADLRLFNQVPARGGRRPFGVAFSPDGARLAVGYIDPASVSMHDGYTLAPLPGPEVDDIGDDRLSHVAWSANGATLYAGGTYSVSRSDGIYSHVVLAWGDAGIGPRRELTAGNNTIMTVRPLGDGDLLVAAADPFLVRLSPDGAMRWQHRSPQTDMRGQEKLLAVSSNGQQVDFGYEADGMARVRFDLAALTLRVDPPNDGLTAVPRQSGLPITGWSKRSVATLAGTPLATDADENSYSLAINRDGQRFVLGTAWSLRAYASDGKLLWRRQAPSAVYAVNITGDGRMVVAAYGDGTIRWHRLDDGIELLAFYPLTDRSNWVAWTPEGLYGATPGARGVLRWHVNHGWDSPAEAIPVHEIPEQHRPEVLPLILQELDEVRALGLVERAKIRAAVQQRTGGDPAGRLHLLAIGVSTYDLEDARHLRLKFADGDARDVVSALIDTQYSLYADVQVQELRNERGTRLGVLAALDTIRGAVAQAPGRDTIVVLFSGHGALIDGQLYLLPHEVNPRTKFELKATALDMDQLRKELIGLAQHARVLVLLDACHAGTATMDGVQIRLDAGQARAILAAPNVTILTSTGPYDPSFEDERWGNGAFTEAFLDALRSHADQDHDGLLSVGDIESHIGRVLPELTGGRQRLGIEKRFDGSIFVAGL